jgi:predicted esterase
MNYSLWLRGKNESISHYNETKVKTTMNQIHQGQRIVAAGVPLKDARAAMVLIHGRGASPESILSLTDVLDASGFAYLAPQAANNSWWPHRFLEPLEMNEPYFSSALAAIDDVMAQVAAAGISPQKTILLGFSQGAVLALEYAARHAKRFGGAVALSGGLYGPDGTPRDYSGSLEGTPVFIGCSDVDFHIPKERVIESADVIKKLGGDVTMCLYRGMGHTINEDEINFVHAMMQKLTEEK